MSKRGELVDNEAIAPCVRVSRLGARVEEAGPGADLDHSAARAGKQALSRGAQPEHRFNARRDEVTMSLRSFLSRTTRSTPLSRRFVARCDCNRPTLASIEAGGFEVTQLERTLLNKVRPFVRPLIVGVATTS